MRTHAARVALNLIVNKDAGSVIPPGKYSMIHDAVLEACDALDGLKDGVIENPLTCKFDYATLACKAGDAADCLTKGQVESARAMTSPLKDPRTGKVVFDPHFMPGWELGWASLGGSLRRRRVRDLRQGHRAVGRAGQETGGDHRVALDQRPGRHFPTFGVLKL